MGGDAEATIAGAVEAHRIRMLYRQTPLTLFLNPVNAAIVGVAMWSRANGALILGWVAFMVLLAAARMVLRDRYLRRGSPADGRWGRWYALMAGIAGAAWGVATVFLYSAQVQGVVILIFVIGGMTAGATGILSYHLPAFYAYMVPTLLPFAVRLLAGGNRVQVAMGVLTLLYGVALGIVARNSNRAISDAFRLRFDNDALVERLSRAQTSLEDSNRTLERRVEERSNALKRQDDALHDARRMESLGLLAGGVAHDFNNLLTVILGNAALLQESRVLGRVDQGPVIEIRDAAERAASLVSQLLALGRRQARLPRVLDLNEVVSTAYRLLGRLIGEHIDLTVALRGEALPVDADPGQLEQVIVNLATNARDAMPNGGKLMIETDLATIPACGDPGRPTLPPGDYVTLSVRDTGVGMDAETSRRVFEPFFTTKELGGGTGLGLATVNGIVEQNRGRVFVESEPGKGSCFHVFLPRAEAAITSEAASVRVERRRWSATALLVEDERLVRDVVWRMLVGAGLTVLEAENGEAALDRARAHEGPIDLLVTDVVMAKMGGPELANRLARERPGLRVLFISGYNPAGDIPTTPEEHVDFLQKPFTSSALLDRVERLLSAKQLATGPSGVTAGTPPPATSRLPGSSR